MEASLLPNVLDSLAVIGYDGPLLDAHVLAEAVRDGLASSLYREVHVLLCAELKRLNAMEESVSKPQGPEEMDTFQLEMKGFLHELDCPYTDLTRDVSVLSIHGNRMLLLSYLLAELQLSRLLEQDTCDVAMTDVSAVEDHLDTILCCYGITAIPPSNTPPRKVLEKVIGKTKQALLEAPGDHMSKALISKPLSVDQWARLDRVNDLLCQEYTTRRAMAIKRVQVTAQSFGWSSKAKDNAIAKVLQVHQDALQPTAHVSIARILSARTDLTTVHTTSRGAVRNKTRSSLNKVLLVGTVPDRGGRPHETRPPTEMPSFKARTEAPQQQRSGRGGRGRVQGGWSGGKKGRGRGNQGNQGQWGDHSNQSGYYGGQSGGFNWN